MTGLPDHPKLEGRSIGTEYAWLPLPETICQIHRDRLDRSRMAGSTEGLERELVQVVRTMEQLQKKYLGLLL